MGNPISKFVSLLQHNKKTSRGGICSVCSVHPWVLKASFKHAKKTNSLLLIESTCNQVNHRGGYTGNTPDEFYKFVENLAHKHSFSKDNLVLGGDHLGPNPWTHLPAKEAMQESKKMVEAYVYAGYKKIHLDTSMSCADDPVTLSEQVISSRAAILCKVAEQTLDKMNLSKNDRCVYVIGTEVPTPGGIREDEELHITEAADVKNVIELTQKSFSNENLNDVWNRVVAVVVQPGVEFGDNTIVRFNKSKAEKLSVYIKSRKEDSIIYEAHSTDYQTVESLHNIVTSHFAILKVGPQLTFAMREALFSLSYIENTLYQHKLLAKNSHFIERVVECIRSQPMYWQKYYSGSKEEIDFAIQFSLSDRIRYYWGDKKIQDCISELINNLKNIQVPPSLISQYLPYYVMDSQFDPEQVIQQNITRVFENYWTACN